MKLSARSKAIRQPSVVGGINAAKEKARASGKDVFDFARAAIRFAPPPVAIEAARLNPGEVIPTVLKGGLPELRQRVAEYISERFDPRMLMLTGEKISAENIFITDGANAGLAYLLDFVTEKGDKILLPTPSFFDHMQLAAESSLQIVTLPMRREYAASSEPPFNEWQIDHADIEAVKRQHPNLKAVLLSNPNNPVGSALEYNSLAYLYGAVLKDLSAMNGPPVIIDESYAEFYYSPEMRGALHRHLPLNQTILIGSFSKTFCLDSMKVGYIAGPRKLIAALEAGFDSAKYPTVDYPAQKAANACLSRAGYDYLHREIIPELSARRKVLLDGINRIPGLAAAPNHFGTCLWVEITPESSFNSGREFAAALARGRKKQSIFVVAGEEFDPKSNKAYVRMAFGNESTARIERALQVISEVVMAKQAVAQKLRGATVRLRGK
ncbi:MAG: pyridoxal phosphate-dependent aminotransferase [Dongiaceae bacterium]